MTEARLRAAEQAILHALRGRSGSGAPSDGAPDAEGPRVSSVVVTVERYAGVVGFSIVFPTGERIWRGTRRGVESAVEAWGLQRGLQCEIAWPAEPEAGQ